MSRTMVDSTGAADSLAAQRATGATMLGGYTDGIYANIPALAADAPPGSVIVEFSAIGTDSGTVGDVESGCIWPPANAVPWVLARRAAGIDPSIYCGRANWPAVIAAFDSAGVPYPHWVTAHYTNTPHFCDGGCFPSYVNGLTAVATQYGGDLAGHYDLSVVADYWPGVDGNATTAESRGQTPLIITPPEADMPLTAADIPIIQQALATTPLDYQGSPQSFGVLISSTRQRIEDANVTLSGDDMLWRDTYNNAVWANTKLDALSSVINDPTSGALVRIAQLQAAVAALPAGTTAADPAAQKALADIATLAAGFTAIAGKLA
jgi:hypothetical protein